jgi:lipopolysaccharide transport system ATP-binding protein
MSRTVLCVDDVSKRYAGYNSELRRFATWFGAPLQPDSEHWAVRDVSFFLQSGQAMAVIGENGAGKSTLLKMITGTVRPTTGRIEVGGRISAILELGVGFNMEFTGRQNVYQAGGLMGLPRGEITALMPEIESFAEIGAFFDEPLRMYSTGMQARLAFALATAVRPDLLIVDEVLSVGDAYFQHKSFSRIRKFKEEGVAILLVTHSMSDVREICDRVLLLHKGRVVKDGMPDEVVDYYNALISEKENAKLSIEQRRAKNGWVLSRSGTFEAVVTSIALLDVKSGQEISQARVGQQLDLRICVQVSTDLPRLVLGIMIRDRTGHVIWGTNTWHTSQVIESVGAGERLICVTRFRCDLGPGSYSISPALVSSSTHLDNNYEWTDNLLVFDVVNFDKAPFIGTSYLDAQFLIERSKS